MTFTTPTFLIFLLVVYVLYWSFARRGKNNIILISSLIFYGWWDWRFLTMLLFIAGIDYCVALWLMRRDIPWQRKLLLGVSLTTNLGALGFFKYFNFFAGELTTFLGLPINTTAYATILPVGISFYTFQALSYTIDVYRRQLPAVGNVVEYFSFITFFPHMVAGPIQQAKHLLVQFHQERHFNMERSSDGLRQMLWGFFKKMVIADNLAPIVAASYGDIEGASGRALLWATYAFAFQIYCDFSGYTDIAIGCARLFDLHMTRNFAFPYFARNIKDFWQRWHISLSTWFREYLYIPLGGNRYGVKRAAMNAFIVFVVSGFWHGASWNYVIWGALHGTYYYIYTQWIDSPRNRSSIQDKGVQSGVVEWLSMFITFQLVCVAWIFFRAESTHAAVTILNKIGNALANAEIGFPVFNVFRWVILLLVVEWFMRHAAHGLSIANWPRPVRWCIYYVIVTLIILHGNVGYTPFIYFQF